MAVQVPPGAKYGDVTARPEVDEDRVVLTLPFVIFLQLASQAASLSAHDRVLAGVVRGLTVIDLGADQVLLKGILGAADGMLDRESQEAAQTVGLSKNRALQQAVQLFPDGLLRNHDVVCFVHSVDSPGPPGLMPRPGKDEQAKGADLSYFAGHSRRRSSSR